MLDSTVVFNEIMYHPAGEQSLEYVELYNQMGVDMDLSSWRLAAGINYQFPEGTVVPSGGYLVVAEDPTALRAATGVRAMGPYTGRLANGGELVELRDRNQRLMDHVDYSDGEQWPIAADGWGASLAKIDAETNSDAADLWTFSARVGGTPGEPNLVAASTHELEIYELGAAGPANFFVELRNPTSDTVDLTGYRLAFDGGREYRFPEGTMLSAGQLTVIDATSDGVTSEVDTSLALLSADGKRILSAAKIKEHGQARDEQLGHQWFTPTHPTPGESNRITLHDEIVINEIMYHHRAEAGFPGLPPTFQLTNILAFDGAWRFNESGELLGSDWATMSHPSGGNWAEGTGLIGYEIGDVIAPGFGTLIANPPKTRSPRTTSKPTSIFRPRCSRRHRISSYVTLSMTAPFST